MIWHAITRFSTTFSTIISTILENIKLLCISTFLSNMAKQLSIHKTPYTLLHPLFTTFSILFTVDEVCNISNKHKPPSNLA